MRWNVELGPEIAVIARDRAVIGKAEVCGRGWVSLRTPLQRREDQATVRLSWPQAA